MTFNIKELGITAVYKDSILSLSSGETLKAELGYYASYPIANSIHGIRSINVGSVADNNGEICDAISIVSVLNNIHTMFILNIEKGGYHVYSSDMADGVVLSMYGWHCVPIEGFDIHKDPRYCVNYSLDRVKGGGLNNSCKAVVSCAGDYGESPRTYFVKGKITGSHMKGVLGLEKVLKSIESYVFCNIGNCSTNSKYTVSEYGGYYLLTHYYDRLAVCRDGSNDPLRLYYRVNKETFTITSVGVNDIGVLLDFIGSKSEKEILYASGVYGKNHVYSLEDLGGRLKPLYRDKYLGQISDAFTAAIKDISKYSEALRTDIDYFECFDIGGTPEYEWGYNVFEGVENFDPDGAYLGASLITKELGFTHSENDRTGLKGSVAVCVAYKK